VIINPVFLTFKHLTKKETIQFEVCPIPQAHYFNNTSVRHTFC